MHLSGKPGWRIRCDLIWGKFGKVAKTSKSKVNWDSEFQVMKIPSARR